MHALPWRAATFMVAATCIIAPPARAQMRNDTHDMWNIALARGWRLAAMAQAYPIVTIGAPFRDDSPLNHTAAYLTQPVVMTGLQSPDARVVLRVTFDLEPITQEKGELNFGGWGEGFIDRRHPHTLVHELMLSVNLWEIGGGSASLSIGRGFAAYGSDDPMSRPGLKYPTNHHLSQILERWTATAAWLVDGWSVEASLFSGREPEDPYDLGGIEEFGDSWSARVARRWGGGSGPFARWEAAASYGSVTAAHGGMEERTELWNATLRHDDGSLYALVEASRSSPEHGDGYYSLLGEAQLSAGAHRPNLRVELATRPEYPRETGAGDDGFFRYSHHAASPGRTRWLIAGAGWEYALRAGALQIRPLVNVQHFRVTGLDDIDARAIFGARSFWSFSFGARLFLGGEPMRMGSYGVLDPMTTMLRSAPQSAEHRH